MAYNFGSKPTNTSTFNAFNTNRSTNFGGGLGNFGTAPSSAGTTTANMYGNTNKTNGFTGGFSRFDTASSFSNVTQQQQQLQQQQQQQALQQLQKPLRQQFPYHGIEGPGHSPDWQRYVDFTQITKNTLF